MVSVLAEEGSEARERKRRNFQARTKSQREFRAAKSWDFERRF